MSEEKEFRLSYYSEYTKSEFRALDIETVLIKCYRNRNKKAPAWIDMDSGELTAFRSRAWINERKSRVFR